MATELLVLVLLVPASLPGVLTGYCAHSYGRSFWLWFALGALAPGVSLAVLIVLLLRKELHPSTRLLAEAQGILATTEAQQQALVELAHTLLRQAETGEANRYQQVERQANAPAP
jgi:hypothetical protein